MASLSSKKGPDGRPQYYIVWYREKLRQPLIYLGHMQERVAERILGHVEDLIAASAGGVSVTAATSTWLAKIDSSLSQKLAKAGLIDCPKAKAEAVQAATLGAFCDTYIASRTDIKPLTTKWLEQARRWLTDYFGEDKPLKAITAGDADEWRLWLAKQSRHVGKALGKNTIRRHCGRARQFFRAAVRKKLVAENPFREMKDTTVKANRERDYFVTREEAELVLKACPDNQWRLLFALSRYGGLRCPSEHRELKWAEVG